MKKKSPRKIHNYLLIFIYFLVLSIVFTYPLISEIANYTSGWKSMNDTGLFLWNFWWVKFALFHLKTNPFYTHFLYYPQQVNLTLHTLTLVPALASSIIQLFTKNIVIVYNILFLLTFALSGLGMYLLTNYISKNKLVSYVAALSFAFCPYVFAHAYAGHFNLISIWTLPFYLYFLLRMFDRRKFIDVVLVALIAICQVYTDFHYLFFMFIFSVIIFIYYAAMQKKYIWTNIKHSITLAIIICVAALPILIPTYKFSKVYTNYQNQRQSYSPAVEYTDLTHYFPGPNYLNKLLVSDEKRDSIEKNFTGGIRENNIFFGYTLMILALLAVLFIKDKRKWLFFTIGIVFFVISLGTHLYYNQQEISGIKLPAYYLSQYFFKNSDLVYGRFSVVTEIMIIILASQFLVYLSAKNRQAFQMFLPLVIILITIEFINAPITLTKYKQEDFLSHLSQDVEDYRIITLPSNLFYQTMLEKPQLVGALGRRAHDYYVDEGGYKNIPGIRLFYAINNSSIVPDDDDLDLKLVNDQFIKYNIKYIVLEKNNTPPAEIIKYRHITEEIMKLNVTYENQNIVVYQVL